jgi:SRSO17 transposase
MQNAMKYTALKLCEGDAWKGVHLYVSKSTGATYMITLIRFF